MDATHNDIMEGVNRLSHRVDAIEERLEKGPSIIAEMTALKEIVMDLKQDAGETLRQLVVMQEDIADTKGIVEAYTAVRTFGKFITWIGGIVAAVVAIVTAFKFGVAADVTEFPGP